MAKRINKRDNMKWTKIKGDLPSWALMAVYVALIISMWMLLPELSKNVYADNECSFAVECNAYSHPEGCEGEFKIGELNVSVKFNGTFDKYCVGGNP